MKITTSFMFILLAVGNANLLRAQVATGYTFSQGTVSYSEIDGGYTLGTNANSYETFNSLDIGFTFRFNGLDFTKFSVSTDGFIVLGPVANYTTAAISDWTKNSNVIAPLSQDIVGKGNPLSELRYDTTGVAPNRILVVQWKNYTRPVQVPNVPQYESYNFQIRLFETSNVIQFVYGTFLGPLRGTANAALAQVGIRGGKANDFQNRQTSTNWSATTAGTIAGNTCTIIENVVPPSGLTFTWTPNAAQPMAYSSSTTFQKDTSAVWRGMMNAQIIGLQVEVSGQSGAPINLTAVKLNDSGSTNFGRDVTKVKIYTTGLSSVFDTMMLFGETTSIDSLITGSAQLVGGANTNYFWITYDISEKAKVGDTIDARCVSIKLSGSDGEQIPAIINPPGKRIITPWRRKADFDSPSLLNRSGAIGFSIGNKCYVGLGLIGTTYKNDFWEYDVESNKWTPLNDFPGTARSYAVAFSIAGKGYVGLGATSSSTGLKDFWEYDPETDVWTNLNQDFPGNGSYRKYAVGFSIGMKGYVGTGFQGTTGSNDFWEFDPLPDSVTWRPRTNIPGPLRYGAIGLSIGTKGYVGTGTKNNTDTLRDFYEFNPDSNSWTQRDSVPKVIRYGIAFPVGSKAYVGMGHTSNNVNFVRDFYMYNADSNTWTKTALFPGTGRSFAVGFSIDNTMGFVSTGSVSPYAYTNDFWMIRDDIKPKAAFSASASNICSGDSIIFTDTSAGTVSGRQWSFPGGTPNTSTAQHPVVRYDTVGTYSVTLTAIGGDGEDTLRKENLIVVRQTPSADAGDNVTICSGSGTTLTASGEGRYHWTPSEGLSCDTCKSTGAGPAVTTTYTLTVTNDNGCTATDSITVKVTPVLVADAGHDAAICEGGSTKLDASGGVTYQWHPIEGLSNAYIKNPDASPTQTTTYIVTVFSGACAPASDSVIVTVHKNPAVPAITQNGNTLQSDPAKDYQWYRNDTLIADATLQSYTVIEDGNYKVVITDSNGCSSTSVSKPITVGVSDTEKRVGDLMLAQNYPNPFSQSSVVSYQLSVGSRGIFEVRDMFGRILRHLFIEGDTKQIIIDASVLPNGVYLYSLNDGKNIQSRMMMVVK